MSDEEYLAVVRMRIRDVRRAKGLRQEDVAERTGMAERGYRRFEAFGAEAPFNPTLLKLLHIAQALDIDPSELVRRPSNEEIKRSRLPPESVRRRHAG